MAVKTSFSDRELKNLLLSYDLGEYQTSRDFEHGADQTNILLITSNGKCAFRYYEKRPKDYVLFEIDLLQYLGMHSYPCPMPVQRIDGNYTGIYKNKPYAIFSFLEGEHSDNNDNYKLVAKEVARLHNLVAGYMPKHSKDRTEYSTNGVWDFAQLYAKKIQSEDTANERLSWLKAELETLHIPQSLPKGACHCDVNPSNFLYKNGKISAVLDFDQAAYVWLLYDVAQMIYWWTWPNKGSIELDKSKELVSCYNSIRKLTDEEKEHFFDVLKLVNLVGIGWSIDEDDFENGKRKVVELNALGKEKFYQKIIS